MAKYNVPLNLRSFKVANATNKSVEKSFRSMMEWMRNSQEEYYSHHLDELVSMFSSGDTRMSGSLNSLGRKLGIEPHTKAEYQPFNKSEMFRASVLAQSAGFIQNELLLSVILDSEPSDPAEIIMAYRKSYPNFKAPTFQYVKRTCDRLDLGILHSAPKADGVLHLWACDTHYCRLGRDGNRAFLTIKLDDIGLTTLVFDIPKKERFDGKLTRPNVFLDKKSRLTFGFTVEKKAGERISNEGFVGVDLGVVEPFVATVVNEDSYSAPILPSKTINKITSKIRQLKLHSASIYRLETLNKDRHPEKAEIQRIERLRIRSKISRLKQERNHHIAAQIVDVARTYNVNIACENLSWVPNSKWDQSRAQDAIGHKARTHGVRVKKVNAKNTSNACPKCGSEVKHHARTTFCKQCRKSLNRDILASRNIAVRAVANVKTISDFIQRSLHTRVVRPASTGYLNNQVHHLARCTT